jgi:hypothetical protein
VVSSSDLDIIESNQIPSDYQIYPESLEFTIRKEISISIIGSGQDQLDYTFKTPCPKDIRRNGEDTQNVKSIIVDPEPSTGIPEISSTSQEMMIWEGSIEGNKELTIKIEYNILTWFVIQLMDAEDSGLVENIPDEIKNQYNHDEWKIDYNNNGILDQDEDINGDGEWDYIIEPSNSRIKSLANELANGEKNVYEIVKESYEYLTRPMMLNYVASTQGLPKDCLTTLNNKQGDNDDYSVLFISLCRALDIPAWLELGYYYDRNKAEWIGHSWVNVFIPLKNGEFLIGTVDIINKQFLYRDSFRFTEWIDTGGDEIFPGETEERNNLDYYYHSFNYNTRDNVIPKFHLEIETIKMEEIGEVNIDTENDQGGKRDRKEGFLPGFESIFMLIVIILTLVFSRNRRNK